MLKQRNRPFLTIPECAEEFSFPVATVRRLVQDGAFPVMKVGSANYIMRETFAEFLSKFSASTAPTPSTPTHLHISTVDPSAVEQIGRGDVDKMSRGAGMSRGEAQKMKSGELAQTGRGERERLVTE